MSFFEKRRAVTGIKARSQSGRIGSGPWAKRWLGILESFGLGARLSRGRSYARTGQVVSIDVSRDGGATWATVNPAFTTVNASSGNFAWTVTGPPTASARVRVTWSGNPAVSDLSNVNFTILDRITRSLGA